MLTGAKALLPPGRRACRCLSPSHYSGRPGVNRRPVVGRVDRWELPGACVHRSPHEDLSLHYLRLGCSHCVGIPLPSGRARDRPSSAHGTSLSTETWLALSPGSGTTLIYRRAGRGRARGQPSCSLEPLVSSVEPSVLDSFQRRVVWVNILGVYPDVRSHMTARRVDRGPNPPS